MNENQIGTVCIQVAIDIHKDLGPGLLESVYEVVLAYELRKRGLKVEQQIPVPIQYQGITFDNAFRADLIVEDKIILELKSVEQINKMHRKQLQTYLRLSGKKLGYVFNFGAKLMKDGIARAVNNLEEN
jgi:GxxExxY protein